MKKFFVHAILVPALAGALFACSGSQTDAKQLEGKWNVVEVKGEKVNCENTPFMEFDMKENKLHGNAGCNIFNTSVTLDAKDVSALKLEDGMTTMMSCPDMDMETKILQSMSDVRAVKAGSNPNEMLLVDAEGNVLMVLARNKYKNGGWQ